MSGRSAGGCTGAAPAPAEVDAGGAHASDAAFPDDAAFLAALADGSLPGEAFDHRAHLRLCWLLLRRHGPEEGAVQVAALLRRFSAAKGAAHKFHVTLTRAWAAHVAAALAASPPDADLERLLTLHPALLDRTLLQRHYTPQALASPEARERWMAPDLAPLP
jgi:hypothetical protein